MTEVTEVRTWSLQEGLVPETVGILEEHGLSTLDDLRHLSVQDVTENFQKPGLLSSASCLRLNAAIGRLNNDSAATPYASDGTQSDEQVPNQTDPQMPAETDGKGKSEEQVPKQTDPQMPTETNGKAKSEEQVPKQTDPQMPAETDGQAKSEEQVPKQTDPQMPGQTDGQAKPEEQVSKQTDPHMPGETDGQAKSEEQVTKQTDLQMPGQTDGQAKSEEQVSKQTDPQMPTETEGQAKSEEQVSKQTDPQMPGQTDGQAKSEEQVSKQTDPPMPGQTDGQAKSEEQVSKQTDPQMPGASDNSQAESDEDVPEQTDTAVPKSPALDTQADDAEAFSDAGAAAGGVSTKESGDSPEQFRLFLIGKTGSGKSTTGNTILGGKFFTAKTSLRSATAKCELHRTETTGRLIEIMDSPGLCDTNRPREEISAKIVQAVVGLHPGPHAILYVVRVGRFTEEDAKVYTRIKDLFDETIAKYTIVLFTGGDDLEQDEVTFEEFLAEAPDSLVNILRECGNRTVIFNNRAGDLQPQTEGLLRMVQRMSRQNENKPYVCPRYTMVGESLEREVARRLEMCDKRELEGHGYVQQLKKQAEDAEEEKKKQAEELERAETERIREMQQAEERKQEELQKLKQELEKQKQEEEKRRLEETVRQECLKRQVLEERQRRKELEEEQKERQRERRREAEWREWSRRWQQEKEELEEELRRRRHEEELRRVRNEVVRAEPGYLGQAVRYVTAPVRAVYNLLERL